MFSVGSIAVEARSLLPTWTRSVDERRSALWPDYNAFCVTPLDLIAVSLIQ